MGSNKKKSTSTVKFGFDPKNFVHLHNHTHYSILDGLQKVPEMLDRILELGMKSVAITDHGTMSGAIEFYKGCISRGIKPIVGMEAYVANRNHTDKDPQKDRARFHLTLLAMNDLGYKNLMKLSSIANLQGFYFKPRIDRALLEEYGDGLIVLSGCIGGEVGEYLRYDDYEKAKQQALWYKQKFGDRYYIEIQDHDWDEQHRVNKKLIDLAKENDIQLVLTGDSHYCRADDQDAHEILLCVQTGAFLSDEGRFSLKQNPLFISEPSDLIDRWGEVIPQAIENTKIISDRCDLKLELGGILIPEYKVPDNEKTKNYLERLTYKGLAERYASDKKILDTSSIDKYKSLLPKVILDRADFELAVINNMKFNDYFLIIWDFIKWGKDRGIVFGPGRGSAAGSIVSYALRITDLDPLKYDLLFERFLNPDRISMPDIDIDIQHNRREEVISYVSEKYGSNRVANIVTFGKMFARNAVRDVARVLQVPYADADRLAKMIPPPVQGRHIPLSKSIIDSQELKLAYETEPDAKKIIDMAVKLEGTIRSHGVHAAGVVVAPDDIVNYTPLEIAQKGVVSTQYSMSPIEEIGLLKMDFLGLSNLTIIKNALRIIKKVYNKNIDIASIPLDDKKTFKLFQKGDTTGVFQFESSGMKRYLRELQPTVFEDIIAMVALYRPGPLTAGLTDKFIARKNGRESVEYDHDLMEMALKNTFGVLVYQEQVMQIAKDMCGFTGGEADTLRKAVGKKIREMMLEMKDRIIDGATKNGVSEVIARKFWNDVEGFADYAFNKSHAACYALISYQTAYLKAHFPAAFMAALMTNDYDNTDRLTIDITECKHMGINVLPPDVNQSFHEFAVIQDVDVSIRFGLDAIKNVGRGAVEDILMARGDEPFTDINNFAERVSARTVNRKNWESLIKAGAMDAFGTRSSLLHSLDAILLLASKRQKDASSAQTDLFGEGEKSNISVMPKFNLTEPPEGANKKEHLMWERELLGLYLSEHPLEDYEKFLNEKTIPLDTINADHDGKTADVGGIITAIRQITTKNGQPMAFVRIEDKYSEIELVVFPNVFKETVKIWERDNVVLVRGKVSATDKSGSSLEEPKILVDSAEKVPHGDALNYTPKGVVATLPAKSRKRNVETKKHKVKQKPVRDEAKLYIRIDNTDEAEKLVALKKLLEAKSGSVEVILVMGEKANKQAVRLPYQVTIDETTIREIADLVGADNVKSS